MRYPVSASVDDSIALPADLAEALGRPDTVEVVTLQRELVVRPATSTIRMGHLAGSVAAIDACRASLPPGIGFTDEEWAELRRSSKEAELREQEQILADFRDDDLPG